jgi:hypothetical protein
VLDAHWTVGSGKSAAVRGRAVFTMLQGGHAFLAKWTNEALKDPQTWTDDRGTCIAGPCSGPRITGRWCEYGIIGDNATITQSPCRGASPRASG